MRVTALHPWDVSHPEAVEIQDQLRKQLVLSWDERPVSTVGGVDVGFREGIARAAVVVLRFPSLAPIESATAEVPIAFPYVPGLLVFREGPAVLAATEKLTSAPDLLLFDAQGMAHPRGIGLACHMGLWLDTPSIGVAKSRLYGRHAIPGPSKGDRTDLRDERDPSRTIGMVLRSRDKVRPLYISPGHLIDVDQSVDFVLACCTSYRLPEPTRWAHKVASGEQLPADVGEQARLF